MQDRFKFRFWNKKDNRMQTWAGCHFYNALINEDLIPMQCTGLKDKNGKLIFEGDILKVANGSINGHILYYTKAVKWEINQWVNCPYWLKKETDSTHFAEIIGNVYENPELLEVK